MRDARQEQVLGWATQHIARLQGGETVQFRPKGHSMRGKVDSGQLCIMEPVDRAGLQVGHLVLCKVNGRHYLHLIKAIQGDRFRPSPTASRAAGPRSWPSCWS